MSGFSAGLAAAELRVAVCRACGLHQTLDPFFCARCGSLALEWKATSGEGYVYAVTEVHRAPSDAYRSLMPFTLVLVDLDDGGRVMGHAAPGVTIGIAVSATIFHDAGLPLLRFVPRGEAA